MLWANRLPCDLLMIMIYNFYLIFFVNKVLNET